MPVPDPQEGAVAVVAEGAKEPVDLEDDDDEEEEAEVAFAVLVATPGPTRCPAGLLVQHPPGSRNFAGTSTHCPIDFWSLAGMAHTTHCPIDFWGFAEPAHTKGEIFTS